MNDCVICRHPLRDHLQDGCHHHAPLRGACTCAYAELPPLPPSATAEAHRERSDWWDGLARTSREMAQRARFDLARWYPLERFERRARQAEIDHRLRAESVVGRVPHVRQVPEPEPVPEYLTVPVDSAQPAMSLWHRLELAKIS